jgi:phosphoheptose isomerase
MDGDGDFVVAWESFLQDHSYRGVFARRFNSSGLAQGSDFQVNVTTLSSQRRPSIAMRADGSFVVAWQSYEYGPYWDIFGRRFNSSGAAQGTEFLVNSYTAAYQSLPAIAIGSSGSFVVVWSSQGQDGDVSGVFGRRFDAAGAGQAAEFQISVRTINNQDKPAIDIDSAGNFVVAWQSFYQDGHQEGVFARRFDAAGVPQTGDVQANVFTDGPQQLPAVAVDASGDFIVSWSSYTVPPPIGACSHAASTARGRPSRSSSR